MSALQRCKTPGVARSAPTHRRATVIAASTPLQRSGAAASALAASVLILGSFTPSPASAVGIESVDILPESFDKPASLSGFADAQKSKLAQADEAFEKSDTLKALLARSEENRAKNRKEIQNKYCYRQAELGVGDCGGLRYIPGMTDSGKQKTPQWLADLLGVEVPESEPAGGKSLSELINGGGSQ